MPRTIITGVVALVVGVLLGVGITLAAVGLLSFALGGSLVCSVNNDGTVTSCTNDTGQQVKVPHHIRIQQ
jgi:hypothetical protein